ARGVGDPAARGEPRLRTPEVEEGELAERALRLDVEAGWARGRRARRAVEIGQLAAVGGIERARGQAPGDGRAEVEPPEELRAGEALVESARTLVELLARDERIRLAPQERLAELAEVPAVADRAVRARRRAREQRGLRRERDRRQHGRHRR